MNSVNKYAIGFSSKFCPLVFLSLYGTTLNISNTHYALTNSQFPLGISALKLKEKIDVKNNNGIKCSIVS